MPEIIFLVALSLVRQLPCCFSFCWCASCTGQLCADCYLRFFDTVPIDGQGETRRVQTQTAADQKRVLIIAEMHARPAAEQRCARAAELMKDKNQTENPADPLRSESAREDRRGRGSRRVPVETVQDGKDKQADRLRHKRQNGERLEEKTHA